jgi:hypothetical protein
MHNYPALIICSGTELESNVVRVKMGSNNIGWLYNNSSESSKSKKHHLKLETTNPFVSSLHTVN